MPRSKLGKCQKAPLCLIWSYLLVTRTGHCPLSPFYSIHQNHLEGLLKHRLLTSTPRLSEVWDGSEDLHQVILMLVQQLQFENH